ncbi:hypothetical protein THASP1DRAFT_33517 [Thamnocephalis sphaerospora]|uniref:Peptidase M1 leukotriene A4 hydrolase/aminopeptidase C-terminal domain-containing protein n=1 Tax=Thamnocephalis sphaerospora TaxID=78915 RepID=A0A4P9XGD7_9FUNG|nr:hypothetical protein THASP1DRAFT_33517 [Thamnocephalis sphaerospora]|eukprot:RKP04684.1 hypothetical protein THASP1DRAFT_33517 [Thamnocephalis sphaerospora]
MGNLVTTKNWEHFWLNEGWTMFIERKIIGRLHGEPARQFSSILGVKALEKDVNLFGPTHAYTALRPNLDGVDPDDVFSSVPYEKGYNLLYYLEQLLGGPAVFEPYMREHVQHFAGKSITTDEWKELLYSHMREHHGEAKVQLLDSVDWDAWLHAPGMPPVTNHYDTTLADACIKLATRWNTARDSDTLDFSSADIAEFSIDQKIVFLDLLADYDAFPVDKIAAMDELYSLTEVRNAEIRFGWQMLCLKAAYKPIYAHVAQFVTEQGRMKYVRPLYRELSKVDMAFACKVFLANRENYHPIAMRMIEKDLFQK